MRKALKEISDVLILKHYHLNHFISLYSIHYMHYVPLGLLVS